MARGQVRWEGADNCTETEEDNRGRIVIKK